MQLLLPLEGNLILPHHPVEIVMGAVLLVVIWLVFARLVSPKLEKNYRDRAEQIQGGIERAERAQAEAAQAKREYETQLSDARSQAAQIRENAKTQAAQIVAEARAQATAESAQIIERGRAQLLAEQEVIVTELKRDVGGLALDLAGRVVAESLTDDERARRSIDRFLDELATMPSKDHN